MMEDNCGDVQKKLPQDPNSQVVFRVTEQQNWASSTITTTVTMQWGSLLRVDFHSATAFVRVCCLVSLCNQQIERGAAPLISVARSKTD